MAGSSRAFFTLLAAACGCGGNAVVDHQREGSGGSELVTASSVTAGVGAGGLGGAGGSAGQPPGGAPPIPPLVHLDLGDAPVGQPIDVTFPENTLGFTAYAYLGEGSKSAVGFQHIVAPDAQPILENYGIAGTLWEFKNQGIITAAMPLSDHAQAMPLLAGAWQLVLGSDDNLAQAPVDVWYRQSLDGGFHGGLVDVNFFVAPNAASESYLEDLAHQAFDGFAGLSAGTVRSWPLAQRFSVVDVSNFFELMEQTAGAPGKPALNVMIVDYIDTPNMPLGFSPGAPGNPLEHGTYQSALVMTVSGDMQLDRVVLRHETGHFSGLLHTSEILPGWGDALGDTSLCPDVSSMLGSCPDATNLMFPYADPGSPMLLSAKQATVVQASALHRGAVEAGGGYPEPLDGSGGDDARAYAPREAGALERAGAHGLPEAAARLLAAAWCGRTPAPWEALRRLGASVPALLSLAADTRAPAYLRARAARLARMLGLDEAGARRLAEIARRAPPAVRAAAGAR